MRIVVEFGAHQDGDGQSLSDDVLALGEHRTLEALHIFDTQPQQVCDLLGRQAGADVRLDLPRTRPLLGGIRLASDAAELGPQHVVEGEREAISGLGRDDETVVFGADHSELFHANRLSGSAYVAHADTAVRRRREYRGRAASSTPSAPAVIRICEIRSGRAN